MSLIECSTSKAKDYYTVLSIRVEFVLSNTVDCERGYANSKLYHLRISVYLRTVEQLLLLSHRSRGSFLQQDPGHA